MEEKYNKTLENVLILADEQVIEICTKKLYYDTCLPRIPQENNSLQRENLCKLLSNVRKCHHFGLNIKEKRVHKKIRHYTMKIVNFNAILLHDPMKNEYYIVFYRSGLSFNANIANFYFSGVANTNKQNKCKNRRKRVIRRGQNFSFKNYLKRSIKQHFNKYLEGEHSLISVHATFTNENPKKSKVFITRDISKSSDIARFIEMIDGFDPTLNCNVNKKMEECLEKLNIPISSVLVVAQINQLRKNLFVQWNDKLVQALHRKNIKNPTSQLVNTSMLNLRLDHIRFNGADCTNIKCYMNVIEGLANKTNQDKKIEKKLKTQLNSCKTFIACLDAFDTSQISDITKLSQSTGYHTLVASSKQDPLPELKEEVGDTGDSDTEKSVSREDKFQGILSKIDILQKRIRGHVGSSPSFNKNTDTQFSSSQKGESQALKEKPLETPKRDTIPKSKFCKPEIIRKDSKDLQTNLARIEEFLKRNFQKNKLQIEGILRNETPLEPQQAQVIKEPPSFQPEVIKEPDKPDPPKTLEDTSTFEKLVRKKLKHPDPELEKLFEVLQKKANSEGFMKIIQHLKNNYENEVKRSELLAKPLVKPIKVSTQKTERPKSAVSRRSSTESHSLKSIFAAKNVKIRPRSKQKHQKKTESKAAPTLPKAGAEPNVLKLENFIDQILKITKTYFSNGSRDEPKKVKEKVMEPPVTPAAYVSSETSKGDDCSVSKTDTSTIITIKKYTKMEETKSDMSTDTVNSFVRKTKMMESAVQTERNRRRRLIPKVTQTDMDTASKEQEKKAVAMETQTDISIHKHAQIKFSGMSMQLSKNVTITNVRKNVINVRNICEETSEAVKRLLEREAVLTDDPIIKHSASLDLRKGNNKAEILGQIKNTLENVIDRFKKSTMLISKASTFADMSENLKKVMIPTEIPPMMKKDNVVKHDDSVKSAPLPSNLAARKEEKTSNLTMSLKLLKNLSEVTKTIRKNPREAARKLHGIRNELMNYRKNSIYNTTKVSSRLYLPMTSSTLTSKQSKGRMRRSHSIFPKDVPLNIYGYPASNTNLKPDLNELNRIFTPKTRSICNTELSIIKHRDRHADHIANHLSTKKSSNSKYCFDFKKFRSKSAQLKSHKCQMYIAKTYKKSYANSLSQTACTPSNVPQIQTAIENPLVPKIVRPVRWKHPLPESPQLSNLSLNDVKPFSSEYPRKDHVSPSTHSYLDRLLATTDKQVPMIKCSDNDCAKCSEKTAPSEVSVCGKSPKETTDFIVKKGKAHFKTETPKSTQQLQPQQQTQQPQLPQITPEVDGTSLKFDFGKFMLDPEGKHYNLPKVNFTVCPVNIIQNNKPESPKSANPPINKKLSEVRNNQNKIQKSIQQAIIQNQEKFQAMQRILTLSKPQERKMSNPSSSKTSSVPPKIKSTHTKKLSKLSDASTSKSRSFSSGQRQSSLFPQQTHSIQTAVATYKTVKQVQPHPKLKQLQQHQIPLKPKLTTNPTNAKKQNVEQNSSANFNKKYSEVSLSSLKTITKEEKPVKTLTQNLKNVKRSQEDIQKYIALVEQKFLKTFSLNEQEKEGAYKNLVDEIQGMLNVLNSKDKIDKKMKIKKSLEKLTKETENVPVEAPQQKKEKPLPKATDPVKNPTKTDAQNTGELVNYVKTLESVEKSLKDFQSNCEENNKISEAATEKLLSWKTQQVDEDFSKSSVSSKTSMQYTLSEKERIIDEKLIEYPPTKKNEPNSVVVIKDPISMATMDQQTSESEAVVIAKKKNSDFSGPTLLSTTITSNDSITETDDMINYSSLSMNSFSKLKPKQNLRMNKSQSTQKTKEIIRNKIVESANSTDTSLIPTSFDYTEDSYLTITEFSESPGSSNSDIKITPLVEFSVEMYLCDFLHYSHRCQAPVISQIPRIHHKIYYTEKLEVKPITQAYRQKYNTPTSQSFDKISYDYPISSSLNFSSILTEDSLNIEQEFIKNYSDRLFSESINTILNKNSDFTLKDIFGNSSSEHIARKSSSNFYDYIDLLSNISRIFVEPEVTQFYQPKFICYYSEPERETRTYYITIIFCSVQFTYVEYNPSNCNLLELSQSTLAKITPTENRSLVLNDTFTQSQNSTLCSHKTKSSYPLTQNSTSYVSVTQNTVSEYSDLTMTQFSNTSVSTADLFSEIPSASLPKDLPQNLSPNIEPEVELKSAVSEQYYSVKSSVTKFEFLNDDVEIHTVTRRTTENVDEVNLMQNAETPEKVVISEVAEPIVEILEVAEPIVEIFELAEPNLEPPKSDSKEPDIPEVVTKPSLEELYVENICFASKKSSIYFNLDNLDNTPNADNLEPNSPDNDETTETGDELIETVDVKRLSDQLAQQSNKLTQLLVNNKYQHGRLPKIVSVKNFNAHKFVSNPVLNSFDCSYDCNYDLKLTISPKYLATNFPSATCLQIMPLLKHRIGSMSHSLTMKIEMNHFKGSKGSFRHTSFKKPKRNVIVFNKNTQKSDPSSSKFGLIQVQKNEMYTESHKMILIFLYVSIFSLIFICMTLNYKCD